VVSNLPDSEWNISESTLIEVLARAVEAHPERPYVRCEAGDITYAAFDRAVSHLAHRLQDRVSGKDVCVFLPNSLAFLAGYFALLRARARPALVNINTPSAGFDKLVSAFNPALVLANEAVDGFETVGLSDADVIALAAETEGAPTPKFDPVGSEDVCAVMFTGGTTGLPKRMVHSHNAIGAAMDRIEWGWPTQGDDVWLPVAPFTHIYGYLMGVTNPILRAGTLVIPPRFQPDLIVDMLVENRVTIFGGGPPAIYQALMAATNFPNANLGGLRTCPGGGAPFPVALHEQWKQATGLTIYEGYGMTEIAPISINTPHDGDRFGSAGKPCPGNTIEIVDLETGETVLPAGEKGEIRVRGPHMMEGYEDDPAETSATLRHGFVYTGDIGMLDDEEFLMITDRKKDVILHKGFNVFPREVEEVLLTVPGTQQACVVGLADARAGEVVIAFVMAGEGVTNGTLDAHAKKHLSAYKTPAQIVVADILPLTANGKLDRLALRNQAQERFGTPS